MFGPEVTQRVEFTPKAFCHTAQGCSGGSRGYPGYWVYRPILPCKGYVNDATKEIIWVKELKRVTSIWIKQRDSKLANFQWQSGYGAFSVSHSEIDRVVKYIENQAEHHRECDYKAEYRLFLERHEIPYDERYVWD